MNPVLSDKFLFAASTGGHLAELLLLANRFDASDDSVWITFETEQSKSLLEGKRVVYVPYIRPRDLSGVLKGASVTRNLLKRESFDQAVSTGAALALSVLPTARLAGIRTSYIESVSRLEGPSMSGRLIALSGSSDLYTQHASWASKRWAAIPSVLSSYESVERQSGVDAPKVFVTLGTIQGYRFDRLVDAVIDAGIANEHTVWQLGDTQRENLPGKVFTQMGAADFENAIEASDIVITHAGVGTILQALSLGKYPVVVPRDKRFAEHVDNHQYQIADKVDRMGIAEVLRPEEISMSSLLTSSRLYVRNAKQGVKS